MPNPRKYSDEQLKNALARHRTWPDILEALGKGRKGNRITLRNVCDRLGFDYSHVEVGWSSSIPELKTALPFAMVAEGPHKRGAGQFIAAQWFLDRGHNVSLPVEPTTYDFVVESREGFKKIQVKMTTAQGTSNRYVVRLLRTVYDVGAPLTSAGKYRQIPYKTGMVDYFFVITGSRSLYLLPFEVVKGRHAVTLDVKYKAFAI